LPSKIKAPQNERLLLFLVYMAFTSFDDLLLFLISKESPSYLKEQRFLISYSPKDKD
jgi:hypothetical protein